MIIPEDLPLTAGLLAYAAKQRIPFHTPGHKGGRSLALPFAGQELASLDLTELPDLDDLHQPSGIIAQSQSNYASWVGAQESFFLVNGATAGIQAALMAVLGPGDLLLTPRNVHKSVNAAMILTGAEPVYYLPEIHPEFGLPLGQMPDKVLDKVSALPDLKAVIVLRPTYYGTVWDMSGLRQGLPNGVIIADEAHGAHFPFCSRLPESALALGADLVVQGSHKTLGALTQGAVLHLGRESGLDRERIARALDVLQTTSPSYLIMASLEGAACEAAARGGEHWSELAERSGQLVARLGARGWRVLNERDVGTYGIAGLDPAKILLHTPAEGVRLARDLAERFGIQAELWDSDNILFLLGAGDSEAGLEKLEQALLQLGPGQPGRERKQFLPPLPVQALTPRQAYFAPKAKVSLREAAGRMCGQTLAPYPPGVPVIVPGEVFSQEIVEYICWSLNQGVYWQGINGDDHIIIIEETGA